MQTLGERSDMFKFGTGEDRSSNVVLNFLEFFSKQSITVIQTWQNKTQRRVLVASSVRR